MKSQLDITISKPCSENFNSFPQTRNGGFCASCTKEVIDFTKMNSDEISNYFSNNNAKNTCGRFKVNQVQPVVVNARKNKLLNFLGSIGLICLTLFSFKTSHAQNSELLTNDSENDTLKSEETSNKNLITVKGTVVTSNDNLPLPGASVILEGTAVGIQTDFDGYFEFPKKLKKGDVLIFSYVGLESQKIIIKENISKLNIELEVNMDSCEMMLMGKVAVKKVYKSKKRN